MSKNEKEMRQDEELTKADLDEAVEPIASDPDKRFWTIAFQYDGDMDPVDPPPHIEERILACMQILHQVGWGLEIKWGAAPKDLLDQITMEG